jgi:hypothetical protein
MIPQPFTMANDYKQLKTQHVSGHVGSSLFDINSVSLSMPVPYMTHPSVALPRLIVRVIVDHSSMVGSASAHASVHTIHRERLLHRSPTELRHYARGDDRVFVLAMALEHLVGDSSNHDILHQLRHKDI